MKRKLFFIFLGLVIIGGSYLRFIGVFTNSFAFTYDVGRDMLAIAQIVYQHKIPLIGFTTGVEGIFYGPWWYYILTIPFALSGGDPQFVAGFMALSGVAASILVYFFGRKIADKHLGFILAFLLAFSPSLIGISSQIWNPNIAPPLVVILLLMTIKLFRKPTIWIFLIIGILLGLLIDTEIVFGLLLFAGYTIGIICLKRKKIFTWQALFIIIGLLCMFAPRIFFELRHQFLMTKTVIKLLTQIHSGGSTLVWGSVVAKLGIFFHFYAETVTGGSTIFAAVLLVILLTIFLAYFKKISGLTKQFLFLSLSIIATFIVGIIFFSHDIWPHYLVGVPVLYIVVTGILLYVAVTQIKNNRNIFLLGILLIFFWLNVQPIQFVAALQKPLFTGDASVYRNQLAIVDYVYQQAGGKPFNYVVYTPPIFAYPYQYLFAWYGNKKYHYVPSTQHEQLFFLIIEPDHDHPMFLQNWLKVREKDGKVVKQVLMKSGVTVQERVH